MVWSWNEIVSCAVYIWKYLKIIFNFRRILVCFAKYYVIIGLRAYPHCKQNRNCLGQNPCKDKFCRDNFCLVCCIKTVGFILGTIFNKTHLVIRSQVRLKSTLPFNKPLFSSACFGWVVGNCARASHETSVDNVTARWKYFSSVAGRICF